MEGCCDCGKEPLRRRLSKKKAPVGKLFVSVGGESHGANIRQGVNNCKMLRSRVREPMGQGGGGGGKAAASRDEQNQVKCLRCDSPRQVYR